jgi:hypothetical protein
MTIPTLFSDQALNPTQFKFMPQGVLYQESNFRPQAGLVPGTTIGMIRVKAGFTLISFTAFSTALGGVALLNVGYTSDNDTGENFKQYIDQSGITNAGGSTFWPFSTVTEVENVGNSPRLIDEGYITFQIDVGTSVSAGTMKLQAEFSYDF